MYRFLTQECALLKYRLDYLSDVEREQFSTEDKNAMKDKLIGLGVANPTEIIQSNFYK